MGSTAVGGDGSVFAQKVIASTDDITGMGCTVAGLVALFNDRSEDKLGFDTRYFDKWFAF